MADALSFIKLSYAFGANSFQYGGYCLQIATTSADAANTINKLPAFLSKFVLEPPPPFVPPQGWGIPPAPLPKP